MRTLFVLICVSLLNPFFVSQSFADSLWSVGEGSIYRVKPIQIRVGDIIMVVINQSTSAIQSADTRTSKESQIGGNLLSNWDQVANLLGNERIRKTYDISLSGDDSYQGAGQTSRTSKVSTVVSAVVTEILENGNLYIVGEHQVKVNNEVETVTISGIVRPSDLDAGNRVNSAQIAKAEISINGSGVVASKQTPGMLTKMFGWLF